MEVSPVTFATFRTIFLPDGSLIIAIPRLIRDFTRRHGLHSKVAMVFMVLTMVLTLAFLSLASAMTGYDGNLDAYVNTTNNVYVPFGSFGFATYVIHDGWRIDKGGEYIVSIRHHDRQYSPMLSDSISPS
jgi:hypothetical protein